MVFFPIFFLFRLPSRTPDTIGSVLRLVGPVSAYCDKSETAACFSGWQHIKLCKQSHSRGLHCMLLGVQSKQRISRGSHCMLLGGQSKQRNFRGLHCMLLGGQSKQETKHAISTFFIFVSVIFSCPSGTPQGPVSWRPTTVK